MQNIWPRGKGGFIDRAMLGWGSHHPNTLLEAFTQGSCLKEEQISLCMRSGQRSPFVTMLALSLRMGLGTGVGICPEQKGLLGLKPPP
jgi:hypothetical protein